MQCFPRRTPCGLCEVLPQHWQVLTVKELEIASKHPSRNVWSRVGASECMSPLQQFGPCNADLRHISACVLGCVMPAQHSSALQPAGQAHTELHMLFCPQLLLPVAHRWSQSQKEGLFRSPPTKAIQQAKQPFWCPQPTGEGPCSVMHTPPSSQMQQPLLSALSPSR